MSVSHQTQKSLQPGATGTSSLPPPPKTNTHHGCT
ncbi:predicted protein [Sclerotinia sclerotiorum 1980 UF-70]|uniref:Uncharacterized protein n=1 Tax=Sclerotinia sclerotiorum (strain ATCC 18683 / 1980 / Ss-1) TaxID=665079 RepID=A7F4T8_SCLS1|nr:predicted protein [Sclerotinia sclerotiorum 1980 UF-70]EDN97759.1 predicted protein [Sclerotinia sclerotiorum 1980 UF-70]